MKFKKAMAAGIQNMVIGVVSVIVGIVLIFYLVGNLAPTLTTASGNISGSGLPLASLFASNGVVLMIFMVGILVSVLYLVFKKHK